MEEVSEKDVQLWLLLVMHDKPMTIRDIYKNGCKKMIYSREPRDLKLTLDNMQKNNLVFYHIIDKIYSATDDGIFKVHKEVFLPYLDLNKSKITTIIGNLKETSDKQFLNSLLDGDGSHGSRVNKLIKYGYYNLSNILAIRDLILHAFGS